MEAVDYLNQGDLCQAEAQTQHQTLRANEHFLCGLRNAVSWIELPPHGSHMKSKPSAGGSAMGSHFCALSRAPDSQSPTEVNMSGSCSTLASGPLNEKSDVGFLSTRCLIYEWIMSERRFSH